MRLAEVAQSIALQVDDIDQTDEVHAVGIEAVPAVAMRPLAVMIEVALAVVFQDVVLTGHGIDLQIGRAQQLRAGVELLGRGKMSDIAGVDQEGGLVFHRGHMTQCLLEGAGDVGVHRLVEAQMTVADLREAEAGLRRLGLSDDARPRDAAGDGPDHGAAGPGHALQESAPVGVVCVDAHARAPLGPDLGDLA